jgi:hypothetical protein
MPRSEPKVLWADVARVRLEHDEHDFFGSGRLIAPNLVLTARHVLETTAGVGLPDKGWEVRLLVDQVNGCWSEDPTLAEVVWRGKGQLDLGLLQLQVADKRRPKLIQLRFGRYNSVMNVEGVWFAGFPWAAREHETIAREYSAPAKLRKADTGGLYRLTVASADAPKKDDDWRGLSGAVVILRKRDTVWLLGAVQQVPKAFGAGALDVAPIEAALDEPGVQEPLRGFR